MMKALAVLATAGFLLVGCTQEEALEASAASVRLVAVIPPNSLYQCPKKPEVPDPATLTDRQVAEYVVRLENGYKICSRSLRAIKAFADGAALSVSKQ